MHDYASIIKAKVTMTEICSHEGIAVNRNGFARCLFHQDKSASMKVYGTSTKGWYCYGCHRGYDVIDFARLYYGLDFKQAMKKLNDDFSLGLPLDGPIPQEQRKQMEQERQARQIETMLWELRRDIAETEYWSAFQEWLMVDRILSEQSPETPFDDFSDSFAWALKHRDEITYNLDIARDKLEQINKERSRRKRLFSDGKRNGPQQAGSSRRTSVFTNGCQSVRNGPIIASGFGGGFAHQSGTGGL